MQRLLRLTRFQGINFTILQIAVNIWIELAWLGAKSKGKRLLVIEIFFALRRGCTVTAYSIIAQYSKQNMIKFSQQPCWIGAKFFFN